jgi:hypothetical protein
MDGWMQARPTREGRTLERISSESAMYSFSFSCSFSLRASMTSLDCRVRLTPCDWGHIRCSDGNSEQADHDGERREAPAAAPPPARLCRTRPCRPPHPRSRRSRTNSPRSHSRSRARRRSRTCSTPRMSLGKRTCSETSPPSGSGGPPSRRPRTSSAPPSAQSASTSRTRSLRSLVLSRRRPRAARSNALRTYTSLRSGSSQARSSSGSRTFLLA